MENILFFNKENGFKVVVNHRFDNKPMIVIFPGGGYHHLSTREAIPVSDKFLSLGYNTTIVYYSVTPHANFVQEEQADLVIKELSKTDKEITHEVVVSKAKEENDVWFYNCKTEPLTLSAGKYMVLYPNDLHCPGVATNGTALTCRKVVVKVKV